MIPTIAQALAQRGYDTLTPVQRAVTAEGLEGADLLVSAQTGSGKTVAFGLAIAPTLLGDTDAFAPAAAPLGLVIAPTRELALQVRRELAWLYAGAGAVLAGAVGGMDMRDERRALERGAHVVVATPGRLRDHIMRGSIDMGSLRAVVLDEADEMLDLGFREDLEFILAAAPEARRTLMFSATVPPGIARLAGTFQRDAVRVETAGEARQHADIEYRALEVAAGDAETAVINVLRYHEAPCALVFCNTRAAVNRMVTRLGNRGFPVVALSGELSQTERSHALQAMRDGRARVCVATDVAARGIDLPGLELVIHAELPTGHETLLHRSGRTGRAGAKGISAMIVPARARAKAQRLLKGARVVADWGPAPSAEAVRARDEDRLMADAMWSDPVTEDESGLVDRLLAAQDARALAAAVVRMARARASAPEELSAPDAPRDRAPFGPSATYSVTGGRAAGADPGRLLAMLCRAGGLTREDVGAIRVRDAHSTVEVRLPAIPTLETAVGPGMTLEPGVVLRRLDAAPAAGTTAPRAKAGGTGKGARAAGPPPPAASGGHAAPPSDTAPWSPVADEVPAATVPPPPSRVSSPASSAAMPPPPRETPTGPPRKRFAKPAGKAHGAPAPKVAAPDPAAPAGRTEKPRPSAGPRDGRPAGAGKANDRKDRRTGGPAGGPPRGGPKGASGAPGKSGFGQGGKPAGKPRQDATDPSRRFVPPGRPGKPGAPKAGAGRTGPGKARGGDATPRRGGPKPR